MKIGRKIIGVISILVGVASYILAVICYGDLYSMGSNNQVLAFKQGDTTISASQYEEIVRMEEKNEARDKTPDFAFWREDTGQTIHNFQLQRQCQITTVKVRGSMEVLYNDFEKLSEEDVEGCLLDETTAMELFGSLEIEGNEVMVGDRSLIVRGILRGEKNAVVLRPIATESTDKISLGEEGDANTFLINHGIQGEIVTDGFMKGILRLILLIFPLTLLILFGVISRNYLKNFRKYQGVHKVGQVLWWGIMLLFLFVIFKQGEIPETMIPDKWSDFSFWSTWWEKSMHNIICYLKERKGQGDLEKIKWFLKGAFFGLFPLFLCSYNVRIKTDPPLGLSSTDN